MKERHFGQKKNSDMFSLVILHRIYSPHFEFPKKNFSEPVMCTFGQPAFGLPPIGLTPIEPTPFGLTPTLINEMGVVQKFYQPNGGGPTF